MADLKKKVLIITYYWPPSGGAGVQRWLKFVKYLPQFGWQPLIITVDESKASYPVVDQTLLKDIAVGTTVFKTDSFEPLKVLTKITGNKAPYGGFANKNKENFPQKMLRFVRGNFFLPDARKGWIKHALNKATEIIRKEDIKTVIISSPPHSSQLIGLKLKKIFPSIRWIADMRDPWTDIYYYKDLLHTGFAAKADRGYERKVLEAADEIIVVSEDIKRIFLSKSRLMKEEKIHVLPNGFDGDDFASTNSAASSGKFVIGYIGTITEVYNPEVFLKTVSRLIKKQPDSTIELLFVGSVSKGIMEMFGKYNLISHCNFVPHVSHTDAVNYMQKSSILFLAIPDVKLNKGILTGKLFEYMAAGRPILCLGPEDGDAAKIIRETNTGEVYNYNDEEKINNALTGHFEKYIQGTLKSESINTERYSRKELTRQLVTLLERTTT